MRILVLLPTLLAASMCSLPQPASPSPGPWRLSGTVFSADAAALTRPLAGATLTIVEGSNTSANVTTDATGRYTFAALESGRFTLAISARGYASVTPVVELHGDTEANFALKPQ
jgi:hypothetical protein